MLVNGDLRGLARALPLRGTTMRNVRQNLLSRSATTRSASGCRRRALPAARAGCVAGYRRGGDVAELGQVITNALRRAG